MLLRLKEFRLILPKEFRLPPLPPLLKLDWLPGNLVDSRLPLDLLLRLRLSRGARRESCELKLPEESALGASA